MAEIIGYADTNLPTVDDIRNNWCYGLPLIKEDGEPMSDKLLQQYLNGAIAQTERRLGVFLKPTVISCNPDERGLVEGIDYEVAEPPYDYSVMAYRQWGFMQLRERPVRKIIGCKLVLPNGMVIIDFMTRPEWVKLYGKQGQIHIVPYAGDPTLFAILGGSQSGYPFVTGQLNQNLPQMHYIDYVAGLGKRTEVEIIDPDTEEPTTVVKYFIPDDIANVVAKIASVDVLGIAGDAILAGVASMSTSIDGISESVSTTASATNATYGAHVLQYQKEIDAFFSQKDDGISARTSERGITMTVL